MECLYTFFKLVVVVCKIDNGNVRILKSVKQTNTVFTSNLLLSSIYINVVNDSNAIYDEQFKKK